MVAFGRLWVDFSYRSLFRQAWTFADVQIDGLELCRSAARRESQRRRIHRPRGQRYADVSLGRTTPRRWLVQHRATPGKVTFNDLSGRPCRHHLRADRPRSPGPCHAARSARGRYAITATVPDGGSIALARRGVGAPIASAGAGSERTAAHPGHSRGTSFVFPSREDASISPPATTSRTRTARRRSGWTASGLKSRPLRLARAVAPSRSWRWTR
jgi:hypothetical protein